MFKTGYMQFNPAFLDVDKNYSYILEKLKDVEADLIVLPELPLTGYNFENQEQLQKVAEVPEKSDGIKDLIKLAAEKDMAIVTGFAEKEGDKIFNSSLFITGDGIKARYRKVHLFFREKLLFEPGNLPFKVHTLKKIKKNKNIRFGMMICFDWFFPEVTRTYALKGAQLICHSSNLVLNYCQNVMLGRSIENMIYITTANRIGTEKSSHGDFIFTGQSQIVAPKGKLLHRSPESEDEIFITEIDPAIADDKNITEMNNMIDDRRPEFYEG